MAEYPARARIREVGPRDGFQNEPEVIATAEKIRLIDLLADAGLALSAVDLFAVVTGPGGFTGLRVGIAATQGLALALDRPALGIPALEALAWEVLERQPDAMTAGAWMQASRGEVTLRDKP